MDFEGLVQQMTTAYEELQKDLAGYRETLKKEGRVPDSNFVRLLTATIQAQKSLAKISKELQEMKEAQVGPPSNPDLGNDEAFKALMADEKYLKDMEKAFMAHIKREMDSGPVIEEK